MNCADIAARIHADMCEDDRNGYSQSPRLGGDHSDGVKHLIIDGKDYSYALGSWDCSSSVIKAWQEAIKYTPFKGKLDGATYTGNMRSVFEKSGLFYSSSVAAKRGDIYLNDAHHTALCQDGGSDGVYGYDAMSQFSINELGKATGGKVGDQTGREAYVGPFYVYSRGWNDKLHYNGRADMGWKLNEKGWWYGTEKGWLKDTWQKIDGFWYYFNADGYAITGWFWDTSYNSWFYLRPVATNGPECSMVEGWLKESTDKGEVWYLLKEGGFMAASETVTVDGKTYAFDADGHMFDGVTPDGALTVSIHDSVEHP